MNWLKKIFRKKQNTNKTYEIKVICSTCITGGSKYENNYEIKFRTNPIGQRVQCKNCGNVDEIEKKLSGSRILLYYIN